jgi:PhoH-like ATPase
MDELPTQREVSVTDLLPRSSVPRDEEVSSPPRTCVVLDTSVLIADPECLFSFPEADAVIPLVVVEELDQHKTRLDDVGRAARAVIRTIEDLRVGNGGDIRQPVAVPGGGTVRIETNGLHLDEVAARGLDPNKADNRILAAALGQASQRTVRVVSNDAALRIKAAQLGLEADEHHRLLGRRDNDRPVGWTTAEVPGELIDDIYESGHGVDLDHAIAMEPLLADAIGTNQFAALRAGSQSVLVRRQGDRLIGPRSSSSPSTSCSTPRSASSRSTASPARARPCSPSPPVSSRRWSVGCTTRSRCTGPSCRWVAPSWGSCPAVSRRSSTRG